MTLLCALLLLVPVTLAALHPSSPCPSIFSYEGTQPEHERWYGIVLLSTEESLVGVRIDIKLDRPAEILVSWMGTVTTNENELFTILSLDQKLHPGPPIPSRFMVKFNAVKGSPRVQTIRLNGRQICPSDPNFSSDVQPNNNDHLYENRYTTERMTKRPDLDFDDDDWSNTRPLTPPQSPSKEDNYKPSAQHRPSSSTYNSHEQSSGYNSHESSSNGGYSNTGTSSRETSVNGGYSNTHSDGSHSSHVDKDNTQSTSGHKTYNIQLTPSISGMSSMFTNITRPIKVGIQEQQSLVNNPRPLETHNPDYSSVSRPSISININKDVTYNVDRPETLSYNSGNDGDGQTSSNREPSYTHNQYPKTTERYIQQNTNGRDEFYRKTTTTTKKPIVINSINININNRENENPSDVSSYHPSKTKLTTIQPHVSNVKTNSSSNSNHQPTQRPASFNSPRPSSSSGHQNNRPKKDPSSESNYQSGYDQINHKTTTEKNYYGNQEHSNQRPPSTDYDDHSQPKAVPSSRPSGDGGSKLISRPSESTSSKHGEKEVLEVSNSNVKCGSVVVNPSATPLITHGQNTARGQWPWHIALYRIEGINLSYSCGGSLISSTVVITAAHCVTKAPRDRPVDADILVVQLGKYHLYQFSDDSVQNKQVQNVHVNPRYNSTNYLDDIAVLILSSPAEYTKYVRPVCLWPKHNFNLQSIDNKEGTVVGWGYDENNQVTEELKMARMPVVSYVTCLKSYPQFFSQFTAENKTFCAGFRQGTSVCNGDSGGGMVFQFNSLWYLRGLVSITVAKQGLRVCDTNHYVVFTDVANYIDWLNQYLS